MTDQQVIATALRRARVRTGAVRFLAVSSGGYSVYCVGSSRDPENAYRVTVDRDGVFRCTCPSELRPACVHRAAVYLVRVQREAGGLPPDGPRIGETPAVVAPRRPTCPNCRWIDDELSLCDECFDRLRKATSARQLEEIAAQFA